MSPASTVLGCVKDGGFLGWVRLGSVCPIQWIHRLGFIHFSSPGGHLVSFHVFALRNNAALNTQA